MNSRFRIAALGLLVFSGLVWGQSAPTSRLKREAESTRTRKRIAEAQQKLQDGKATEAIDELQKVLDESGDELVLVKDNNFQPARRLVQLYLASLPTDALKTLRDRLEEPAKKLLEAGRKNRDTKPLRECVERYFVSRPSQEALLLLGEFSFERGDYSQAIRWWSRLGAGGEPRYPEPTLQAGMIEAKIFLARLMQGERETIKTDLDKFKTEFPKATGRLAGAEGNYSESLAKWSATPPVKLLGEASSWTSFAGNAAHDGHSGTPLPRYWASRPTWKTSIPRDASDKDKPKPASFPATKSLAFHPVVLDGNAYVADAGRIFQFDLKTGAARVAYHFAALDGSPDISAEQLALPNTLDADFALTVGGGQLFARLGNPTLPAESEGKRPKSFLVALQPRDLKNLDADALSLNVGWQLAPPVAAEAYAAWEGAPAYRDGRLYAAYLRVENSRIIHAIACYPERNATKPIWTVDVCDSEPSRTGLPKNRHELLTVAGSNIAFATQTGYVVAVNAETGQTAWAYRTLPAARPPVFAMRDLVPPLYSDGRIFVAPADGDGIFALDAETGKAIWSETGFQVEALLGATRDRLIATIHSPNKGIRGFDVRTGRTQEPDGWQQHDDPFLASYGRGLVADNMTLWPTKEKLYLLDTATGRVARPPIAGPHGNMAFADGVVLVATPTELWGYAFDKNDESIPPTRYVPLLGLADPKPSFDPGVKVRFAKIDAEPTTVSARADIVRTSKLPDGAWPLKPLSEWDDNRLSLCDGRSLFAVNAADGKIIWQRKLEHPTNFETCAKTTDGNWLALGTKAIAALRADDGTPVWSFQPPETDGDSTLDCFTFIGSRLVCRCGSRSLLALDLKTGVVAWLRDPENHPRFDPFTIDTAPEFGRQLGVRGNSILVQRGGESWEYPVDGSDRRTRSTSANTWASPPFQWNREFWQLDSRGEWRGDKGGRLELGPIASRSGIPPSARVLGRDLLVAVERNFGTELTLFDPKPWSIPRLIPGIDIDLSLAEADEKRIYLPTPEKLYAFDRLTGRELWRAELPNSPKWNLKIGAANLIAYPANAIPKSDFEPSFANAFTPLQLFGCIANFYDAATDCSLPLMFLDPESGRLLQRLDLPMFGPRAIVAIRRDSILVAGVGRSFEVKSVK